LFNFCLPTCFSSTFSRFSNAILLISCVDSLRLTINWGRRLAAITSMYDLFNPYQFTPSWAPLPELQKAWRQGPRATFLLRIADKRLASTRAGIERCHIWPSSSIQSVV
jgi:hypothetical protein